MGQETKQRYQQPLETRLAALKTESESIYKLMEITKYPADNSRQGVAKYRQSTVRNGSALDCSKAPPCLTKNQNRRNNR